MPISLMENQITFIKNLMVKPTQFERFTDQSKDNLSQKKGGSKKYPDTLHHTRNE